MRVFRVNAGQVRFPRFQPMGEASRSQKFKAPVDCGGGRAATPAQFAEQFIGAERCVSMQKDLEYLTAERRKTAARSPANQLCLSHGYFMRMVLPLRHSGIVTPLASVENAA